MIRYDMKEDICLRLGANGGRPGKETGAVSLVWGDSSSSARGGGEGKTMTPQEATALVLEQVQRTFVHLRDGERRFFDPIRLVEACRCLNLEYMVHQQNDASEFCDKLLDRLEMGMKAGQAAVAAAARTGGVLVSETGALDAYGGGNESGGVKPRVAALDRLFGGTWVHQKIPTGCSHRTNRLEPFINLEVNIRGKESIEESLASFVESELMAGDNKVGPFFPHAKAKGIGRRQAGRMPMPSRSLCASTFQSARCFVSPHFGRTRFLWGYEDLRVESGLYLCFRKHTQVRRLNTLPHWSPTQ